MVIRRKPEARRGPQPTLKYGDTLGNYVINGFAGTGATSFVSVSYTHLRAHET